MNKLDFNKNLEIIPIELIKSVLINETDFLRFIKYKDNLDYFNNLKLESFLSNLNDYMDYIYETEKELDKKIFDRINFINQIYKINKQYDYDKYLNKNKKIINTLKQILDDEKVCSHFINCISENNSFLDLSIDECMLGLQRLNKASEKGFIKLKKTDIQRYNVIKLCYLYANIINAKKDIYIVNKDLKKKIMEKCNKNFDKLALARTIYLETCKNLEYDIEYVIGSGIDKEKIDNLSIENINPKKNKIICSSWSKIYSTLCNENGIPASIIGDKHKFVILNCNNYFIKADATNAYKNTNETFKIADTVRVKLGLETAGFNSINECTKFKSDLQTIDSIIKYNNFSYEDDTKKLIIEYNQIKYKENNDDLFSKLNLIHSLLSKKYESGIYKTFSIYNYLKILIYKIFIGQQLKVCWCGKLNNKTYNYTAIVSIFYENNIIYYEYNNKGFNQISYDELKNMLNLGIIKIIGKNCIPGIEENKTELKKIKKNYS